MKLTNALVLGTVAAGSLAVALPAEASHRHDDAAAVVAKRDYGDYRRDGRDERADERRRAEERQSLRRESGDSRRYGYGYERRQRNAEGGADNFNADEERRRNRREERREERRDERRGNDGWR